MRVEVVNLQFPFMLLILTSFFAYFSVISFYIYSPVMGSTGDDDDIYCGQTGGDCNGSNSVDEK